MPLVGVLAATQRLRRIVEQLDEVFDDDDHVLGRLSVSLTLGRRDRRGRFEHADLQSLRPTPTFDDAELDSGAALEGGDAVGECVGMKEDVAASVIGKESKALFRVVPLDLA